MWSGLASEARTERGEGGSPAACESESDGHMCEASGGKERGGEGRETHDGSPSGPSAPQGGLLDSARKGWAHLSKTDFAALGWTGRKAKDQSPIQVDESLASPGPKRGSCDAQEDRASVMVSLHRFKQLLVGDGSEDGERKGVDGARVNADADADPIGEEHCKRSPFAGDCSSPHMPFTPGRLARHLTLSPQDTDEDSR